MHWISSLHVAYCLYRLQRKSVSSAGYIFQQWLLSFELNARCNAAMSLAIAGIEWKLCVGGSMTEMQKSFPLLFFVIDLKELIQTNTHFILTKPAFSVSNNVLFKAKSNFTHIFLLAAMFFWNFKHYGWACYFSNFPQIWYWLIS